MVQGSHLMTNICSRKLVIFYSGFDFPVPKFIHLRTLLSNKARVSVESRTGLSGSPSAGGSQTEGYRIKNKIKAGVAQWQSISFPS